MPNFNINNGFIQPILKVAVGESPSTRNVYTREWQFRAWSNHLSSDQHYDFLTQGAAIFWLWVIDEIHRGRSNRMRSITT